MAKQPTSIRLSDTAELLRDKLAATLGVSKTAVVELALRSLAKRHGIKLLLVVALSLVAINVRADCPAGPDPWGIGRPPVIRLTAFYGFRDYSYAILLRTTCRDTNEVLWWHWYVFACPGDCEAVHFPETAPWFFTPNVGRIMPWWKLSAAREGEFERLSGNVQIAAS